MAHTLQEPAWLPLERILIDPELDSRPARAPDFAAENRILVALAHELSKPESDVLHVLSMSALALCGAGSAGISLIELEENRAVFRWHSIVGELAYLEGGCIPRDASPCGHVIKARRATLMANPERHYPGLTGLDPPAHEALLIPFTMLDQDVGTVWIVSHDPSHGFDAEDRRLMTSLAGFASAAFTLRASLQSALDTAAELSKANRFLRDLERKPS